MHWTVPAAALVLLALSGCTSGVKEIEIHIGWSPDGKTQYMRPEEIRVQQGDKVRFLVTNDDDPKKDYNGARGGLDNFHDVALLDYDGDGDGIKDDIEHEVPAGTTTKTQQGANDYFVASTKGEFKIICEVLTNPSHEALGMHAKFIVT